MNSRSPRRLQSPAKEATDGGTPRRGCRSAACLSPPPTIEQPVPEAPQVVAAAPARWWDAPSAQVEYVCEWQCGFEGTFDEVAVHELTCSCVAAEYLPPHAAGRTAVQPPSPQTPRRSVQVYSLRDNSPDTWLSPEPEPEPSPEPEPELEPELQPKPEPRVSRADRRAAQKKLDSVRQLLQQLSTHTEPISTDAIGAVETQLDKQASVVSDETTPSSYSTKAMSMSPDKARRLRQAAPAAEIVIAGAECSKEIQMPGGEPRQANVL